MVPAIPIAVVLLPAATPVLTPARRLPAVPLLKICGRPPVVENRHAQYEIRYEPRLDQIPWAVVPRARVPIIVGVGPVKAIVEKQVRIHPWSVIDGVAGNRHKLRISGQVDPYADARQVDADADADLRRRSRRQIHADDQ